MRALSLLDVAIAAYWCAASTESSSCAMARCLASGSASICSSCCRIFFCGPRFFGAAVAVGASCATSASSVVCNLCAITGSNDTGTRRRPFSNYRGQVHFLHKAQGPQRCGPCCYWALRCRLLMCGEYRIQHARNGALFGDGQCSAITTPQIGRFLSVDPVTAYENPLGAFNRYKYANNNPYRFTDPDGRDDLDMFALTDPLRVTALRFRMPGWFTVMGHGGYAGTSEYALRNDAAKMVPFTGPRLNAEDTANTIKQAGFENWKYAGVFLGHCQAGTIATEVSRRLNSPVMATTGFVYTQGNNKDGDITYRAYNAENSDGSPAGGRTTFNVYSPNGAVSAKYSEIVQSKDGSVWGRQAVPETGTRIRKMEKIK